MQHAQAPFVGRALLFSTFELPGFPTRTRPAHPSLSSRSLVFDDMDGGHVIFLSEYRRVTKRRSSMLPGAGSSIVWMLDWYMDSGDMRMHVGGMQMCFSDWQFSNA